MTCSGAGGEASSRRSDVALALFDAYNSVSCCFLGNQLVSEVLLPGLRCLQRDLAALAMPDHAAVTASMVREFEDRVNSGPPGRPASTTDGGVTTPSTPTAPTTVPTQSPSSEGLRLKMMGHFKDVQSNLNLSKMFNTVKK